MMLLLLILALGLFGLAGYGIFSIVQYRTNSEIRASKEKDKRIASLHKEIANLKTRNLVATDSLNKISSDYTHNPALEARLALDDMRAHEIKELNE